MTDLMSIVNNGNTNIKLEITSADLLLFAQELINQTVNEFKYSIKSEDEDSLLTKAEVKERCNVCDATLWHWNKKDYLKPVKVGMKVMYRLSDVKKILGQKSFNTSEK